MKLLQLTIDNRWTSADSNDFNLEIGVDRDSATKFVLKMNDEIGARILEVLMPEVTEQVSNMFETLTGHGAPDDTDDTAETEPCLPVDNSDD